MSIIIDNNLIKAVNANITVQSTASSFAKVNVMNHINLKRRWRMDSANKSNTNPVMYFDLGSAQTVAAVVLDDVNFDKVTILGHASDLSTDWTTASFDSTTVSISLDAQVNRYKVYIPLTAFNYRYLAIIVPTTASAVGTYTDKWEIGRVGILDTATEFSKNMSYGYERGAERAYREVEFNNHVERDTTNVIRWVGTLHFSHRTTTQEANLTTLNNMDIGDTLIFYENNSDTSKVYFCLRDSDYSGTVIANSVVTGSSIRMVERI
jgi:hypothetical protein